MFLLPYCASFLKIFTGARKKKTGNGLARDCQSFYCISYGYFCSVCAALVGCFGFNGPLRQYFSLYRAFSQREGEKREMIVERKNIQTTPSAPTASAVGPCPTIIQISRTPQHRKFTRHHRTTRPSPYILRRVADNRELII